MRGWTVTETTSNRDGYFLDPSQVPPWAMHARAEEIELNGRPGLKCSGCGNEWNHRKDQPSVCADCNAKLMWDDGPEEALLAFSEIEAMQNGTVDLSEASKADETAADDDLDDLLTEEEEEDGTPDADDLSDLFDPENEDENTDTNE